jgi:hypothetical protein
MVTIEERPQISYTNQFLKLLCKSGKRVKPHTWKDKDGTPNLVNQRIFALYLGEKMEYTKMEDWYEITTKLIKDNGGGGLLAGFYSDSVSKFVMEMFPKNAWEEWKFKNQRNIWKDKSIRRKWAIKLGKNMEYEKWKDWYKVNAKIIQKNDGGGLLARHYNYSPYKLVMDIFKSDYNWVEWKFVGRTNWKDKSKRKRYAIWLENELGYKTKAYWYHITAKIIANNYGSGMLQVYYNGSPSKFLMDMFPDYDWVEWEFDVSPNSLWHNKAKHNEYAIELGKKMGYQQWEDWYKIRIKDIQNYHGGGLLNSHYNNSARKFVMDVFPEHDWDISKFKKNYSRGQIQWLEFLKISTPDIRHILNHPDGEFPIPGSREFTGGRGPGYHADGFSEIELIIYEYLGDKCHGNPAIYKPDDWINWVKATAGELYNKELKRRKFCEDSGFGYHSIWESEWHRGIKAIRKLQRKFKNRIATQ